MTGNRRIVAAGAVIFILTALTIYRYGVVYLGERLEQVREEREMKVKTLSKYRALLSKRESISQDVAGLKRLLKDEELKLLSGNTPALASASLQEIIKQIITAKGATISSERVEKTEDYDGYRVVSVSVDMIVDGISSLNEIIYSIESRTPYMVIRELDVRVRNYRNPAQLTVRLKVSGLSSA